MTYGLPLVRCDLHVHSVHSGPATLPGIGEIGRESHSAPEDVYETARRRGMDLVTLTDHDSIDGALVLRSRPETFLSEEVTGLAGGGGEVHLGVFDITEVQHQAIQGRRRDLEALLAYLAEERIPAAVNHPFAGFTNVRDPAVIIRAMDGATLVETRNGAAPAFANARARGAARRLGRRQIGGSDAHTLASVGRAFTCVPGRTREDFLEGLRRQLTLPAGRAGTYRRLTADVVRLVAAGAREILGDRRRGLFAHAAAGLALTAGMALVPLVTLAVWANEHLFAWRCYHAFAAPASSRRPRVRGPAAPASAAAR